METLCLVLIILGALIMASNIVMYFFFAKNMHDIIFSGKKKDEALLSVGMALLVFFLIGYILVGIFADRYIMTSLILFFGSIYVSVMLLITSKLIFSSKKKSIEIASVLIGVIDARDPNLNGHSHCVKNVAMLLYSKLPLPMRMSINPVSLEFAALLHDIGKLGVPESILNKPAKLDDEEWKIMKEHPKFGVKILEPISSFNQISNWILYHHERIDGKGYYGIKENDIPLAAKILAIADTYSAITMRRSYKDPRTHEDAIKIIKDVAGTQLDKSLVDVFVTIPKDELQKCIPEQVKY